MVRLIGDIQASIALNVGSTIRLLRPNPTSDGDVVVVTEDATPATAQQDVRKEIILKNGQMAIKLIRTNADGLFRLRSPSVPQDNFEP